MKLELELSCANRFESEDKLINLCEPQFPFLKKMGWDLPSRSALRTRDILKILSK